MKTTFAFIAAFLFFAAFIVSEDEPFIAFAMFIGSGFCLQKAGIVNFKEEINKPY